MVDKEAGMRTARLVFTGVSNSQKLRSQLQLGPVRAREPLLGEPADGVLDNPSPS